MSLAAAQKPSQSHARGVPAANAHRPAKGAGTLAWLLLAVAGTFAYLYMSLFSVAGGVPHLRSGDQDFFWTYATRLLSGQVFLKDFHQFTPPGTDLVYAAVFRAFGANAGTIDWTILALGVALATGCFVCARCILE